MVRRDFIKGSVAGCAVAASGQADFAEATLRLDVEGFSCVTCARGLETVLRELQGVSSAAAVYPDGSVQIGYVPALINPENLRRRIESCGFSVRQADAEAEAG